MQMMNSSPGIFSCWQIREKLNVMILIISPLASVWTILLFFFPALDLKVKSSRNASWKHSTEKNLTFTDGGGEENKKTRDLKV